jgi:hypothetical protein
LKNVISGKRTMGSPSLATSIANMALTPLDYADRKDPLRQRLRRSH